MRQFLKDENGGKMLAATGDKQRKLLFQISEIISRDMNVETGVVNTYDPLTDRVWLGLHLLSPQNGVVIGEELQARMRRLWREFLP